MIQKTIRLTAIFKMDNQQGPTVQHRKLFSMLCGSLDGSGVWERMDTCICIAESLCCSLETITTLLISYTLIQNKKFKVGEEKNTILWGRVLRLSSLTTNCNDTRGQLLSCPGCWQRQESQGGNANRHGGAGWLE